METPIAATITDYVPPANEVTEEMYNPNALVALRHINPETNANTFKLYKVVDLEEPVHVRIPTLEAQVNTLRDTITKQRELVRNLYRTINDTIDNNELNEDDTLTYAELSEILESIFTSPLQFQKEYQAWVEFKVRVTVDYKASSDDAQSIAESINLEIDDANITYDGDAEVSEVYVEDTRVLSVEEQ
jgi:vancomycin resistance protein YoaR